MDPYTHIDFAPFFPLFWQVFNHFFGDFPPVLLLGVAMAVAFAVISWMASAVWNLGRGLLGGDDDE